ncbi:MAG: hypothetical protein K0Q64_1798 [Nitrobacter vulgaris]|jgi:hypothetical protein|nr:hypothetical protein [Nitrobacter vulgaris]
MRGKGIVGAILALTITPASPAHAQTAAPEIAQSSAAEYALKAAFLYKFAPFVEWPPRVFPTSSTPLTICIAGSDPFGLLADQVMQSQEFGPRGATLRRIASVEAGGSCHVMFVGQNGGSPAGVRDTPVLTITDGDRGPDEKGIIHFVIRGNRVRFEIDDHAAQQSGLSISSKLLSLAESVRSRG